MRGNLCLSLLRKDRGFNALMFNMAHIEALWEQPHAGIVCTVLVIFGSIVIAHGHQWQCSLKHMCSDAWLSFAFKSLLDTSKALPDSGHVAQ